MGIVVDHPAEEAVAIVCILRRVEDVLMPELIEVVLAFSVRPRYKHEAGLHPEECEEADVFVTGGVGPFQRPVMLLYYRIADGVEIELFGGNASLRGERRLV